MTPSPPSKPTIWQTVQPILLREAIVFLEGITHLLGQATAQLKTTASNQHIPSAQLAAEASWLGKLTPWLQRLGTLWWQAMGWLQQRLPSGLRERYNRTTLTAIALGILLLLLWLNPLSWFQAPERPTISPSTPRPRPEVPSTILVQPRRSTSVEPPPAPTPVPTVAPVAPAAVAPPSPSPAPIPSDTATVRQQLLAICDRYSNALDPTLTLNPSDHRLDLMLAAGWYDLSAAKQDQLAQALWQQAHDLGYTTVVITDTQGQPLVREPVVGNNAIVVRRKLP
ncbi:hypothetical protein [Parathermosynechococcus lividus]